MKHEIVSGQDIENHFADVGKMVVVGTGAEYPSAIALGQTKTIMPIYTYDSAHA